LKVQNGQLTLIHMNWSGIVVHGSCDSSWDGIIKIYGVSHTITLNGDNTYSIDGEPSLAMNINDLTSFDTIEARGTVKMDGPNQILIDDAAIQSNSVIQDSAPWALTCKTTFLTVNW
jgi:hypothetical protein